MHEHEIRSGQSIDLPYASVKAVLEKDALGLFQRATTTAATHAGLDPELHVTLAGHDLHRHVHVEITSFDRSGRPPSAQTLPGFAVSFRWRSATSHALFPSMRAELTIYALSSGTTQLDLHGWYKPPGGAIGAIADDLGHHRLAQESVHRFLEDVAHRLTIDAATDEVVTAS